MENFDQLGVQEMNIREMKQENGGSIADYLVEALVSYIADVISEMSKIDPQII
jgi:hypothetical protein